MTYPTGRIFKTLMDAVYFHAECRPEFAIYNELSADGDVKCYLTYSGLVKKAKVLAAELCVQTVAGDRVLLLLPGGANFAVAFLACMFAGLVAVPCYPIRAAGKSHGLNRALERLALIVENSGSKVVVCENSILECRFEYGDSHAAFDSMQWVSVDEQRAADCQLDRESPGGIAFLQYTSGSTAFPKGVVVTHECLVANFLDIDKGCVHDETSVMISWAPVYHDLGLIYGLLLPLYQGVVVYSLQPAAVLQRPVRWLQAVTRYKGSHSAAPNFAYELCVNKVTKLMKSELDLSSWKVSINAAEHVRPSTLEAFKNAFSECGLNDNVICPAYGLAEATLKVTSVTRGNIANKLWVDSKAYEQGEIRFRSPVDSSGVHCLQSCGWSHSGADIRIVDVKSELECDPGRVGEIWVSSLSVTPGYWNCPEASKVVMEARLPSVDTLFLRTGDLGFIFKKELYVCGRLKDMVIVNGRNIYPEDLESTIEKSQVAIRAGRCCAFGVSEPEGEKIVLVAEIERTERHRLNGAELSQALRTAINRDHELVIHDIVFIRPGTFPVTTSGKVQRGKAKNEYISGRLEIVYSDLTEFHHREKDARLEEVGQLITCCAEEYIKSRKKKVVGIERKQSFHDLGLDSIELLELTDWLAEKLGRELPAELLLEYPTVDEVSHYLVGESS